MYVEGRSVKINVLQATMLKKKKGNNTSGCGNSGNNSSGSSTSNKVRSPAVIPAVVELDSNSGYDAASSSSKSQIYSTTV